MSKYRLMLLPFSCWFKLQELKHIICSTAHIAKSIADMTLPKYEYVFATAQIVRAYSHNLD